MSKGLLLLAALLLAAGSFALGRLSASPRAGAESAAEKPASGALADALEDPDAFRRTARLAALLPALGPEALPELRATLEATPGFRYGPAALELLVRAWATHEPEAAAVWAFSSAPPGCSIAAIEPAVEGWAQADPLAAVQYLSAQSLLRGSNEIAQVALVRGWFRSGAPGLEDYVRDRGIGIERQRALAALAGARIRSEGAEAARHWAEALPDSDEPFKREAFTQLGGELAKADAAAAVAFCDAHCAGPYGESVRAQIATLWAGRDGLATMQWLAGSPAGKDRDAAVEAAFYAWRHSDNEGLQRWLATLDAGTVEPWFRPAAARYAVMLSNSDPVKALEWAALVEDDLERELAMITIARRWRKQDERAADAWLDQSPLSEEARGKARNPNPRKTAPPPTPKAGGPSAS